MGRMRVLEKTVTTAGTAEPISATDLFVSWFLIEWRDANSGASVYRGDENVDDTYPAITTDKGFTWSLPGRNANLKDWFLDVASSGDGVFVTYEPAHIADYEY